MPIDASASCIQSCRKYQNPNYCQHGDEMRFYRRCLLRYLMGEAEKAFPEPFVDKGIYC